MNKEYSNEDSHLQEKDLDNSISSHTLKCTILSKLQATFYPLYTKNKIYKRQRMIDKKIDDSFVLSGIKTKVLLPESGKKWHIDKRSMTREHGKCAKPVSCKRREAFLVSKCPCKVH